MNKTQTTSPQAGIDSSAPQSGVKSADSTKIITTSQHAHGGSSHRDSAGENPKEGRITGGK
jgi:hypothetical protein